MDQSPAARPRFQVSQPASAMRPLGPRGDGRPIWDLCCAGTIERVEEHEGAFYYAIESPAPPHLHRECEVAAGGAIDAEVNRLNNAP